MVRHVVERYKLWTRPYITLQYKYVVEKLAMIKGYVIEQIVNFRGYPQSGGALEWRCLIFVRYLNHVYVVAK